MSTARKGANRAADIPADILSALSQGEIESATLVEITALDQGRLLRHAVPQLSQRGHAAAGMANNLGVLKRMAAIAAIVLDELGPDAIELCRTHRSDTVRGWACFMVAALPGLQAQLQAIRPLADDSHFGVREWAWMALRPALASELHPAITSLQTWTCSPSERIRRFACESLRPRGVWCAHLAELKREPALALPILEALCADPAIYVQDSVANWLNDAGKDQPDWVRERCRRWLSESPATATQRICQRAQRKLA